MKGVGKQKDTYTHTHTRILLCQSVIDTGRFVAKTEKINK